MSRTIPEILRACPSTEPATFNEFLRGLKDIPERGDREEWADLFDCTNAAENLGLIEVERSGNKIESLILTDDEVAKLKSK